MIKNKYPRFKDIVDDDQHLHTTTVGESLHPLTQFETDRVVEK